MQCKTWKVVAKQIICNLHCEMFMLMGVGRKDTIKVIEARLQTTLEINVYQPYPLAHL